MSAADDYEALPAETVPVGSSDLAERDPEFMRTVASLLRLPVKYWFRSEVRDIERVPEGGALIVSNHSGGPLPFELPVIAIALVERWGLRRMPIALAHDMLQRGALGRFMRRNGVVRASRENAHAALTSGHVTIVFPGGDYDALRPTWQQDKIDFNGRQGYIHTAYDAGVPIVPAVVIGGQETQLHLSRGEKIAELLHTQSWLRTKYVPVTIGFPFGVTLGGLSLPLPSKLVAQILYPIDLRAIYGDDLDVDAADRLVRDRMQDALTQLAEERRFPIIG